MPVTANEVLGPALGFLFTTATLLFIAFFAHKTVKHDAPAAPAESTPEASPQ